jgi:two-component system cell cycle sensor histidine kinase/response regulator CckA
MGKYERGTLVGSRLLGRSAFRSLADTLPVMLWFAGPDSGFVFCNRAWLDFRGRRLEQEINTGWMDGIHPDDRADCVESYRTAFDARQFFQAEFRLQRFDGLHRWILNQASPWYSKEGEFIGYVGSAVDISDRAMSEERAFRLAAIVDSTDVAVIGKTLDGLITNWNAGAERLFGYSADEMIGQSISVIVPESRMDELLVIHEKIRHSEHVKPFATLRRAKDGTLFEVLLTVAPILDRKGNLAGMSALTQDVPISIEQEIVTSSLLGTPGPRDEQLRQSQKMEVMGRLAGGVAHDFNNLLTIISGYSDMALDQLPDDDPTRDLVNEIRIAGERAASLTRQLLAFSRKQSLETTIVDVNTIVSSNETMLRRLLGEDIEFTTVLAPDIDPIAADQSQMEQVLFNLAVNAREAMPQGGKLTIETGNVQLDTTYCASHVGVRTGRYVMLAVSDTGRGIDTTTKSQMFEPFFTTKDEDIGTGLGLAMVSNFIKQLDGHISVYSEPGSGATFKIYLPAIDGLPATRSIDSTDQAVASGHETILLVEDDDAVRSLTQIVLQSYGYHVLDARNGADAIRTAENFPGTIDLLVTDVVLPDCGGRQIADHLVSKQPSLKVLYVSGYTDEAVVRHGVLEEDENFLQKPFVPNGLLQKVRDVLDA